MVLPFLFFAVVLLAASMAAFLSIRGDLVEENRRAAMQLNDLLSSQIGEQLLQMADLGKLPLVSEEVEIRDILVRSAERGELTLQESRTVGAVATDALLLARGIHSAFIFDTAGNGSYQLQNGAIRDPIPVFDQPWFAEAIRGMGTPVFIPTYDLGTLAEIPDTERAVFGVARAIVRLSPAEPVGVIVINTGVRYLRALSRRLPGDEQQRTLILTHGGQVMYDSEVPADEYPIESTDLPVRLDVESIPADRARWVIDRGLIAVAARIPHAGWPIVTIVPAGPDSQSIRWAAILLALATVALVAMMGAFFAALSRRIVAPIGELVSAMQQAETGDLRDRPLVSETSDDEIGSLTQSFRRMVARLNELIEERYLRRVRLKQLEIEQLQSRINPHFLYNSLATVHMLAEANDDREASAAAEALGRALKYSITRYDELVPLREEVRHLRDYIELYRLRYESTVDVRIDVQRAAASVLLPKLLVQPLVENAFRHGVGRYTAGGVIRIRASREADRLVVAVDDNGPGASEIELSQLRTLMRSENAGSGHLGLRNVHRRLVLTFGEDAGLKLGASHWGGFSVSFSCPAGAVTDSEPAG